MRSIALAPTAHNTGARELPTSRVLANRLIMSYSITKYQSHFLRLLGQPCLQQLHHLGLQLLRISRPLPRSFEESSGDW